ncbi:MAG: PPOX class F420-dependent oxidoreductase [Kineosporiaceae bacterium]
MSEEATDPEAGLWALLAAGRLGVLATIKRDGRPQLSTVVYRFDADRRRVTVSITSGRAKTANLRRDPRAALHVSSSDGWSYVVAEATAVLSPVAQTPDDEVVDHLVEIYRAVAGEHSDWQKFRQAMVAERRLVLTLPIDRVYGMA